MRLADRNNSRNVSAPNSVALELPYKNHDGSIHTVWVGSSCLIIVFINQVPNSFSSPVQSHDKRSTHISKLGFKLLPFQQKNSNLIMHDSQLFSNDITWSLCHCMHLLFICCCTQALVSLMAQHSLICPSL